MKLAPARAAAIAVLGFRVAYGAGLLAAPGRLGRPWLGGSADTAPTQIPLQALGTREIVLHCAALIAASRGGSLRPWLAGSVAGDLTDVAATVARREQLPAGAARATVLVGGGSALVSAVLACAVES
ncbi:MAG: hypothetical protein DLM58_16265 [Pseudonocardiales bacterium]|nr:MAG: hypothetical protein DLM58_16265 [Pseudonocardiales bacterium]